MSTVAKQPARRGIPREGRAGPKGGALPSKVMVDRRDAVFLRTTALELVGNVRASLGLALAIRDLHKLRLDEGERQLVYLGQREASDEVRAACNALTDRVNDLRGTVALAHAVARQLNATAAGMRLAVRWVNGMGVQ